MIIRIILIFSLLLMFSKSPLVQAKEEKVKSLMPDSIEFIEEYKNIKAYKLNNGLKVLLKPNHSIPLVTFSIWYKVGSRNETEGIRGIAHFLEHMMFKGTKKFKKGEISDTIQKCGGVFNAFTFSDGTAYYETVSPKYLEKMIEIEADRMKNSRLAEDELQLEKNVVLSELEGDLNNPSSLLDNKVREAAYNKSPYKHPTIGYIEDIKDVTSKKMHKFYQSHYNPKNSTIIVVGDFKEEKTLKLIEKYFGSIKNTETKNSKIPVDKKQTKEKRVKVTKSGVTKFVEIAYHIPSIKHDDIYALNIIEEILIKGKKSRLEKTLIEKGLATDVSGGAEANTDPGLFYIIASLTPDTKHEEAEKIITKEIESLRKKTPSEKEINAAINRIKASYLFNLDGTYNQAVNIGFFEVINSWKQALDWPNLIDTVTKNDVKNVLDKYFDKENRVVGYFIPELKKGEKYEPQPINLQKTHHYTDTKKKSVAIASKSKTRTPFTSINYTKRTLSDGSELIIYKDIDLPITYITGLTYGGESLLDKEKEWTCELLTNLHEKGSKNYSKEDIEDFLDSTGSQFNFSCDVESFKFKALTLNENLDATVNLLFDILINPTFPQKEFDKEKEKLIAEIIEQKDSPYEISKRKFTQLLYPNDHPFYMDDFDNDISRIKKFKKSDLESTHNKLLKTNKMLISLVSNIDDKSLDNLIEKIEAKLESKSKKLKAKINIPDVKIKEKGERIATYLKDKPQSDVFIGHTGKIKRIDPDFYKLYVANHILGGSTLTSRLAKKVRDESGLVYTVFSYIDASYGAGEFGVYLGTNNNNVDKAIKLVKEELGKFVKYGISEDELEKAKSSLIDSFISRNLSTYSNISSTLLGIEFYELGKDYLKDYPNIISSLKLKDINKVIKEHIFPDKLNISIAGEYKQKLSVK